MELVYQGVQDKIPIFSTQSIYKGALREISFSLESFRAKIKIIVTYERESQLG